MMIVMNTEKASQLFENLSSPIRLSLFRLLVEAGGEGIVAGDLAKQLAIAPNNLSFHLKQLSKSDLVISVQEGRFIRYYANLALMTELIHFLTDACCKNAPVSGCKPFE